MKERKATILSAVQLSGSLGVGRSVPAFSGSVAPGECVAVVGTESPDALSAAMMLLGGIIAPTSGHLTLFDAPAASLDPMARRKRVFLPRWTEVGHCESAWEYLLLVGEAYGMTREELIRRATPLCEELDFAPMGPGKAAASTATIIQVPLPLATLAGAFVPEVPLRILDAPFHKVAFDPCRVRVLCRWLHLAKAGGETLLLSIDPDDPVAGIADRIWCLGPEGMMFDGTPAELIARQNVDRAMEDALGKATLECLAEAPFSGKSECAPREPGI